MANLNIDLTKGLVGTLYSALIGPSDGIHSTELTGSAAVGTVVSMLPIAPETKAWILGLLAAVYSLGRAAIKVVETWKARPGPAGPSATIAPVGSARGVTCFPGSPRRRAT